MSTKKYKIVKSKSIVYNGRTLYRIRALRDFNTVTGETVFKGDLGGFIETENNLSQEGYCWIFNNAKVYDDARVSEDAKICGGAEIFDSAEVFCNAEISGKTQIFYDEMYNEGIRIGNGYDKEPEPIVPAWEKKKKEKVKQVSNYG